MHAIDLLKHFLKMVCKNQIVPMSRWSTGFNLCMGCSLVVVYDTDLFCRHTKKLHKGTVAFCPWSWSYFKHSVNHDSWLVMAPKSTLLAGNFLSNLVLQPCRVTIWKFRVLLVVTITIMVFHLWILPQHCRSTLII